MSICIFAVCVSVRGHGAPFAAQQSTTPQESARRFFSRLWGLLSDEVQRLDLARRISAPFKQFVGYLDTSLGELIDADMELDRLVADPSTAKYMFVPRSIFDDMAGVVEKRTQDMFLFGWVKNLPDAIATLARKTKTQIALGAPDDAQGLLP